jgi:hypothetical protein
MGRQDVPKTLHLVPSRCRRPCCRRAIVESLPKCLWRCAPRGIPPRAMNSYRKTAMHNLQNAAATSTAVAAAESEALATQAVEDRAEERFVEVRAQLAARGKAEEATQSNEFREWMAARARTDEAWGRWAMAMDAVQG